MATVSTDNYSIGMPDVYFCNTSTPVGESVTVTNALTDLATLLDAVADSTSATDRTLYSLGNLPEASISPEYNSLEHYVSNKGAREKDKEVITEKNLSFSLSFDEINISNVQRFLMASMDGTSSALMSEVANEGCALLVYKTDIGNSFLLAIPRCTLIADGEIAFASEDWMSGNLTLKVLSLSAFDASALTLTGATVPTGTTSAPYGYIQSEEDFGTFYITTESA